MRHGIDQDCPSQDPHNSQPECAADRVIASRSAALLSSSQLGRVLITSRVTRYSNRLLTIRA
jgi:hypothetical protein